jgi:hypothetical protein
VTRSPLVALRRFKDALLEDEIGVKKIQSEALYQRIFDATISTAVFIGKEQPHNRELELWHQNSMYRVRMSHTYKKFSTGPDILLRLGVLALLLTAFFFRSSFATHLKVAGASTLLLLPFINRWEASIWFTSIMMPLVYIHPLFQVAPTQSNIILPILLGYPFTIVAAKAPWCITLAAAIGHFARLTLVLSGRMARTHILLHQRSYIA